MFLQVFRQGEGAPTLQADVAVRVRLAVDLEAEVGVEDGVTHLALVQHAAGAHVVVGVFVAIGPR